jgi:AmmeMemoRadiSam system protein B
MLTRKAMFAGSWYPASASECENEIKSFLRETRFRITPDRGYIGGIVPHAGWFFSGSLACNVIAALRESEGQSPPDVVVIFGMHLHPGSSPCIMAEGSWETPLGDIDIESDLAGKLMEKFSFKIETPTHFNPENTIELQTPFVKYFFPNARLLPIGAPPNNTSIEIAKTVTALSDQMKLKIKVIGSTDLTHYGSNYGFMPAGRGAKALAWAKDNNDKNMIDHILTLNSESVIREGLANLNACCAGAAAAAIEASKALGASAARLAGYSSSHEKNPGDSFVGYAGILFHS